MDPVLYGANARLARDLGVPFIDGGGILETVSLDAPGLLSTPPTPWADPNHDVLADLRAAYVAATNQATRRRTGTS